MNRFLFLIFFSGFWLKGNAQSNSAKIRTAPVDVFSAADRRVTIDIVKKQEPDWDEAYGLLKIYVKPTANHYHSRQVGKPMHPLRDAVRYASNLLNTGDPVYQQRAFRVLEHLLNRQDSNPASPTYGVWPYYDEEPLDKMAAPDYNWADFISVNLLEDYINHANVLPVSLREKMKRGIIQAAESIQKRDVKPGYTNIAIMGTFVTYATAHLFDIPTMKTYADMRLKRFYDFTIDISGFTEYNSPTYTRVAMNELARLKKYLLDPEALRMTDACYRIGWQGLASHFHPPTGQLAGPHSRSYSTLMQPDFLSFLADASGGRVLYGKAKPTETNNLLRHRIPGDLVTRFQTLSQPDISIDTFGRGPNPPIGYTYLRPEYTLGTVSQGTLCEQSRPFIAYWGTVEQPRYLRVRLLHDFVDFCAGYVFTAQKEGKALSGISMATNGGDYHPTLDRLKNERFEATDLRLRFELSDPLLLANITLDGPAFSLTDAGVSMRVQMLRAKFGDAVIRVEKGASDQIAYVDWIVHAGPKQLFNLAELNEALFAWVTAFSAAAIPADVFATAQLSPKADETRLSWGNLSLHLSTKPTTKERFRPMGKQN